MDNKLSYGELLKLKRWNTPTIFNGWEKVTKHDISKGCFNLEETRDFMPELGPMVGFAVTLVVEPSQKKHRLENSKAASDYRKYIASLPGPKIIVVQDLDKPETFGSFWGEVSSNIHRALGCVGTITDGAIRDVSEMYNAGFKAIAKRMCVGHAYVTPVCWGCEVEVFGCKVKAGQLIHADQHGFLVIPDEDTEGLLEAVAFMDAIEASTKITAARNAEGKSTSNILRSLDAAFQSYEAAAKERFDY